MDIELIENLRKIKKMTQKEFAEMIDFTVTGYQKMIKTRDIKVSSLERICEVFNVNILTFFGTENVLKDQSNIYGKGVNVHLQLDESDILKIDLKNKRLEIIKK
jgi:transcriptional regulator with XRE-family HTH domain